MAEKRYSKEDQQKMKQDLMGEIRERGIADVREVGGLPEDRKNAYLKSLLKNPNETRDQSQSQLNK